MLKDFLSDLFPPDLLAYIPGQKLIAGLIVYAAAEVFDVAGTTDVAGVPVNIPAVAAFLAFYLWPTNDQIA